MNNETLLLVDDDSEALESLIRALKVELPHIKVEAASSKESAFRIFEVSKPQVCVLDLDLGTNEGPDAGFSLLSRIIESDSQTRVVILTGHGSNQYGIKALQLGAAHFLEKPANIQHLSVLIKDGFKQAELRSEFEKLKKKDSEKKLSKLLGESEKIKTLRDEVAYAASMNQPVLLVGETGTGKGVCARLIHQCSSRSSKPFIRYQPNFSESDLVASELFGHKKGAFTGATENRVGLVKDAHLGTLFIDEVQELPLESQIMLLDTLQEKRFRSLGANSYEQSDFRLICAMNTTPEEALESGKMRKDFYHRIAFTTIKVPALRERKEDLQLLVKDFLTTVDERESLSVTSLSEGAFQKISSYDFPGNVRELEALIETSAHRARFLGRKEVIESDLRIEGSEDSTNPQGLHEKIEAYKSKLILETLSKHHGNQVKTAEELGIDRGMVRRALRRNENSDPRL